MVTDHTGDGPGQSERAAPVVTLHVWRVARRRLPGVVGALAVDRHLVRRLPGVSFAKLLGTGSGRTFAPRDAELTRWALLTAWSSADAATAAQRSDVFRRWQQRAEESWRADLRLLTTRGRWARREPFRSPAAGRWDGPVAAVTRARLAPRRLGIFWRAVPPVTADLHAQSGLRLAFGIGEAPVGVQGTFSVWRDAAALRDFAYSGDAHRAVIRRTAEVGWYAEQLFARFALTDTCGTIDGRDPMAVG